MKGDVIAGVLGLLAGAAVVAGAVALGIGAPTDPEPGFFPFLGGMGIIATSAALLVQARLGRGSGGEAFGEIRRPAMLAAALAGYVAILEPAGYLLATALAAPAILWVLGITSWIRLAAGGVLLPVLTWLLFARALGVDLPVGQWTS